MNPSRRRSWRLLPRRPATPKTCWTWISISKPTSASNRQTGGDVRGDPRIYDIPRDQNLKLRDYPTLSHVIRFVHEKRPDLADRNFGAAHPGVYARGCSRCNHSPEWRVSGSSHDESIKEKVLEIVAAKTGYPKDMLDLDLDLEADLGVDTVKQAEMFAAVANSTTFRAMRTSNCATIPHCPM